MDRIALALEVQIVGGRPTLDIKYADTETGSRPYLDDAALVYETKVVPGSPELLAWEKAPEQMRFESVSA